MNDIMRIVSNWFWQLGMKAPEGAGNARRRRHSSALGKSYPSPEELLACRRATQELIEDLAGVALLFGVLFAALCVGGW